MIRPMARQKGLTDRGTMYVLSQWAPNSIQLTLQSGDKLMSETLENLQSESEMLERRNALEDEFIAWINNTTENTDETNQPILLPVGSDSTSGAGMDAPNPESV